MSLVPPTFLFRYTLPAQRVDRFPRSRNPALSLPESCQVPLPSTLDDSRSWGTLALGWNPHGFAIQVDVSGKKQLPICNPDAVASSDAVLVWIDTRDTQTVHRASRYCHHFLALPQGKGAKGDEPVFRQRPVPRAREDAPLIDEDLLQAEADVRKNGYRLSLWFPAEVLHGFDPATQRRIGFYLLIQDSEHGRLPLAVGDEFPFEADPSQWVSVELAD